MKSGYKEKKCGLLGKKLGHSFSPMIHGELSDYSYELIELDPQEVESFVKSTSLDAFNVTVPYKKAVIPFIDVISKEAEAIGAVNTVVRNSDGRLYGYNTDYFGFSYTLDVSGIDVLGKSAIVFGNGGASATVQAVLRDRGVKELTVITRADNTPQRLANYRDCQIVVNATPVGMYPNNGNSPVDLSLFPNCEGVLDLIYNPAKTALLLDAEARGIPYINGLPMLVAQAVRAFELFTNDTAENGICEKIISKIEANTQNVILIGMPGCGKSTVGKLLAKALGRPFFDADEEFTKAYCRTPADVITENGEECFRQMEHSIIENLGKMSGTVISCGGGVVTRKYNYAPLHQNGKIVFLERDLEKLSTKGRPLSQNSSVQALYNARIGAYREFADITVKSTEIKEKTAELMIEKLGLERKAEYV